MYWADSVRETTASTGTGTLALDGAYRGHQTFLTAIGNSKAFYYCIRHRSANLWEVGIGTLSAGVTLTRVKVLAGSSGAGVAVTFTAGTSDVFLTEPSTAAEGATHLKKPCRVASLANLTVATGLNAGDTVNGVVLVAGDRVLLTAQTTVAENGVYLAGVTPARAEDLFTGSQSAGVLVPVQGGTTFGNTLWQCTAAIGSDIVGTNSLTWVKVGAGTGGAVGPNPSTINSVPRWDSTDGTTLEDSEVLIYPSSNDKLQTNATFMAWTTATDGATVAFDFDQSDKQILTEGGNRTLSATNVSVGQRITLARYQDGTGGRVDTWFVNISWDNGLAPVQDPTAAGWDLVVLDCIGLDGYSVPQWIEVCRTSSAPRKGITTATDGATVTFDLRVSPKQVVTLGGNRTLEVNTSSFYVGMTVAIGLIQDGTGSRTVTWGTSWGTINWRANNGTEPTQPTVGGAVCWLCFICRTAGGSPVFDCVGISGQAAEVVTVSHLIGGTAAPAIAAGAGAGTGPTVAVSRASDLSGVIEVTTGTTPTAAGVVATLTFAAAYTAAPNVQLTPANAVTAALYGTANPWPSTTTTTLVLTAGAAALTASTAYKWFYQLAQ